MTVTYRCPGLGEQFNPFAGEQLADPYPFYSRARAEEPVFYSPALDAWFVTRYADITAILADSATYSSANTIPDPAVSGPEVRKALADYREPRHLVSTDPPRHTRLRLLVRHGFTPRRVAAMAPTIREVTTGLVDGFAPDGQVELMGRLAYPLPLTVILRILGVPAGDLPACRRWAADFVALYRAAASWPLQRQVECARNRLAFRDYTVDVVKQRAAAPRGDLISHLLTAREAGVEPLSVEEIAELIPGLIVAGYETTANLIGNTTRLLLTEQQGSHPGVQRDGHRIEQAVEEALRADSPVVALGRTATREVTLAGVRLPAGTRLFLLFGSANHDESRFTDPERFRLDRPEQVPHLAFGRGIHFCLGAPLARLEARIALDELYRRLPRLRLADEQNIDRRPSLVFRGLTSLKLNWDTTPDTR